MARAKQTNRAEARKRYRQATQAADFEGETAEADSTEIVPNVLRGSGSAAGGAQRPAAGKPAAPASPQRPGFMAAFRGAYHPAHVREDLANFPKLVRSPAMLAAVALAAAGALIPLAFPLLDGSRFACQLILVPGSALAPQLVAGFFAPRASYLLGLIVGLVQGVLFVAFLPQIDVTCVGGRVTSDMMGSVVNSSFLVGPLTSALFAAAAAWYRRFLALSSPRRAQQGRPGAKPAQRRSTGRR